MSNRSSLPYDESLDECWAARQVGEKPMTSTELPILLTKETFVERPGTISRLSYAQPGDRRTVSSTNLLEDTASIKSTDSTPKWYRRFSRNNSESRLHKAVETSSAAFVAPPKAHNPYARQRSAPISSKTKTSIVGQSASQAIEVGGHASNASQVLPAALVPERCIEIPYIVDACISWLVEHKAQSTPGIFRINGSNQAVTAVLNHFSSGCIRMPLQDIEISSGQALSVFDVASCLKKFLVLLPGGLLGRSCFLDLLDVCDNEARVSPQQLIQDIREIILHIPEAKRRILIVLFAFLRYTADQASFLSFRDDTNWQEAGYMNAQSLSIVFAPTCLGTKDDSSDMSRSSTSQSDRSFHSNSTSPIEEAVAIAKQGAQVVKLLINKWGEIVHELSINYEDVAEDQVSKLDVVGVPKSSELRAVHIGLGASPIARTAETNGQGHQRNESVDTITVSKRCNCATSAPMLEIQIEALNMKISRLEQLHLEATDNLHLKSEEISTLYARNLELEREVIALRTTSNKRPLSGQLRASVPG